MSENKMVERVAEALWKAAGFGAWHSEGFANRPDYIRAQYLRDARAAIEAMAEASDEFLETVDFHSGEHSRSGETYPVLRNFLRSFVAAALKA